MTRTAAQRQQSLWALTVPSAKEAVHLYFAPVRQIAAWLMSWRYRAQDTDEEIEQELLMQKLEAVLERRRADERELEKLREVLRQMKPIKPRPEMFPKLRVIASDARRQELRRRQILKLLSQNPDEDIRGLLELLLNQFEQTGKPASSDPIVNVAE